MQQIEATDATKHHGYGCLLFVLLFAEDDKMREEGKERRGRLLTDAKKTKQDSLSGFAFSGLVDCCLSHFQLHKRLRPRPCSSSK